MCGQLEGSSVVDQVLCTGASDALCTPCTLKFQLQRLRLQMFLSFHFII